MQSYDVTTQMKTSLVVLLHGAIYFKGSYKKKFHFLG